MSNMSNMSEPGEAGLRLERERGWDGSRPINPWVVMAVAIGLEVVASLSLKGAVEKPLLYGVATAGYVGSFMCLAVMLRLGLPLGVVYGVWGAMGVTLTAVLSAVIFGEALNWVMAAGIACAVAGVLLVETGSASRSANNVGRHVAEPT